MDLRPASMSPLLIFRSKFIVLPLLMLVVQYSFVAAIPTPAESAMVVPETAASEMEMMQPRPSLGDKWKSFRAALHQADSAAEMHDAHASIFGYSPAPKTAMIDTSVDGAPTGVMIDTNARCGNIRLKSWKGDYLQPQNRAHGVSTDCQDFTTPYKHPNAGTMSGCPWKGRHT